MYLFCRIDGGTAAVYEHNTFECITAFIYFIYGMLRHPVALPSDKDTIYSSYFPGGGCAETIFGHKFHDCRLLSLSLPNNY